MLPRRCSSLVWHRASTLCFTAISALWIGTALSASPFEPGVFSRLRLVSWAKSDGLPDSTVLALAQTTDGYLWVGTASGLARFDGVRFKTFDHRSTPAFRSDHVRALCASADGSLWIGSADGAVRYKDGTFSAVSGALAEPYRNIFALHCLPDGTAIAGTRHGGLFVLDSRGAHPFPGWTPATSVVTSIRVRTNGEFLIATFGNGLFRCHGQDLACDGFARNVISESAKISAIHESPPGQLWVALYQQSMVRIDLNAEPVTVSTPDHLTFPEGVVRDLVADTQAGLWIANRDAGLISHVSGRKELLARFGKGKPTYPISLLLDRDKNIWFGSEGAGLHRLSPTQLQMYGASEGWSTHAVQAVLEGNDGVVWVGTKGDGLLRIAADGISRFKLGGDGLSASVTGLAMSRDGSLWIATRAGIYSLQPNGTPKRDLRHNTPHGLIAGFFMDDHDRLWAGGDAGLFRLEHDQWVNVTEQERGPIYGARTFEQGRGGDVWIGSTGSGLIRYGEGRYTPIPIDRRTSHPEIDDVLVDSNGRIWGAARGLGLFRVYGDEARSLASHPDIPETIYSITEDSTGNIWLCASTGLLRIAQPDWTRLAAAPRTRIQVTAFDSADGLRDGECMQDAQPLSWLGRAGILWLATTSGVVQVRTDNLSPPSLPEQTRIESVSVEGRETPDLAPLRAPADTHRIEIAYSTPQLTAPELVHFRYQLEGLSDQWISIGARRQVDLNGLRPGAYTFSVVNAVGSGPWSKTPARFSFEIQTPFVQSRVFFSLLVAAITGIATLVAWLCIMAVKRRARIANDRNELARELHDTLAQSFSGMLMRLEVARRLAPDNLQLQNHLTSIQSLTRDSLGSVRKVVAQMRPAEHAKLDFPGILRQQCAQQLSGTDIRLHFSHEGTMPVVSPYALNHLCRIVEEAVSNAMLHSGTPSVTVTISGSETTTTLAIADFGLSKSDVESPSGGGSGLHGMRQRALELGATLDMVTKADGGLLVRISCPNPILQRTSRVRA